MSEPIDFEKKYQQLKWLLSIQEQLFLSDPEGLKVDEFAAFIPDDYFFQHYYRMNRPLIFKNVASNIFRQEAFDWEYLKKTYGKFELKAKKTTAPNQLQGEYESMETTFGQFIEYLLSARFPEYYATAYDGDINRPLIDALIRDQIQWLPEFIDQNTLYQDAYPWIGPANTITRAHIDMKNGLLVQLIGRKQLWLFPYYCYEAMYPTRKLFSSVEFSAPDTKKHAEFFKAKGVELILEPGDAIFLPVTWWHRVQALDPSLSVSFFNFTYTNEFCT